MDVSIVVTCWNGSNLLQKNLPIILKAAGNSVNKVTEVIVVDDGSTDDSVKLIESFKDAKLQSFKFKLIRHEKNMGYSATCNTGVKEAKGELVVILNLDVIPNTDFLRYSLPHFKDEKIFSVSFNEGKFGPGKLQWQDGFWQIIPSEICDETSQTDWPSGGSSIFSKKRWEEVRGMNEIYLPFYFEDVDLGLRAKRLGFNCLWEPKSIVEHKHEATINADNFNMEFVRRIKERNQLLLCWLNFPDRKSIPEHFKSLFKRCIQHPGYLKIFLLALRRLREFDKKTTN